MYRTTFIAMIIENTQRRTIRKYNLYIIMHLFNITY